MKKRKGAGTIKLQCVYAALASIQRRNGKAISPHFFFLGNPKASVGQKEEVELSSTLKSRPCAALPSACYVLILCIYVRCAHATLHFFYF